MGWIIHELLCFSKVLTKGKKKKLPTKCSIFFLNIIYCLTEDRIMW